jgi:hypothetical protein
VIIPFDLSKKKKGAMMQQAIVSHVKTRMGKIVKKRELPCVRRLWSLYSERFVCCAVPMSMERIKSDDKAERSKEKGMTENK